MTSRCQWIIDYITLNHTTVTRNSELSTDLDELQLLPRKRVSPTPARIIIDFRSGQWFSDMRSLGRPQFSPRDALQSAVLAVIEMFVRLSVCPSPSANCVKMKKRIVKLSRKHCSSILPVSDKTKTLPNPQRDHPQLGHQTG